MTSHPFGVKSDSYAACAYCTLTAQYPLPTWKLDTTGRLVCDECQKKNKGKFGKSKK